MSERPVVIPKEPFICTPEEYLVAESLFREAKGFGAKLDDLRFFSQSQLQQRTSLLEEGVAGIGELRSEVRSRVLEAHGANGEDISVSGQLYKIGRKEFGGQQPLFWAVWKDGRNETMASGKMEYLVHTPFAQKLINLERTGRSWNKVAFWNLGSPALYLDADVPNFVRIKEQIPHFLFSDEIEKLKNGESIITHSYHELYQEEFEGYMVDKHPKYDWPIIFKVRASLVD